MPKHTIPLVQLCHYSTAAQDTFFDRDGFAMSQTQRIEDCPLHLEQRYAKRCPCKQRRKIGENILSDDEVGNIVANCCTFPETNTGQVIRHPDKLADWVRRQP